MWKGRYQCAVTLSVDFDAETLWSGTFKLTTPSSMSRGDYDIRAGLPRILGLLDKFGGMAHACELETSLELAIRPELVDMEAIEDADRQIAAWDAGAVQPSVLIWRPWLRPDRHSGIVGDLTLASAESGRTFLEEIVKAVSEHVERLARGESVDYYTQPVTEEA